jgi:hypothetical protein
MSKSTENITTANPPAPHQEDRENFIRKEACLLLLKEGKSIQVTAQGMSMYPFIKSKDSLKIASLAGRAPRVGDIVAVNRKAGSAGWFVVHRLVKVSNLSEDKQGYFTKGDFYNSLDRLVAIEDIAGVITMITRHGVGIDLDTYLWRLINAVFARLSCVFPGGLVFISRCMSLFIERKTFLFKLCNRLKKGNPVIFNAQELFLLCSRSKIDQALIKKSAQLTEEGVDWEYFCSLVTKSKLVVLVSGALDKLKPLIDLPEFVFKRLLEAQVYILPRVISQKKELSAILEAFSENSLPVVCLKGPELSQRIYGDDSARGISADIDLLIKEEDKLKAQAALETLGYSCVPDIEIKEWSWQFIFFKPGATTIDLHWDITMTMRSRTRIEGLWGNIAPAGSGGLRHYELNDETLLLYLCAHLTSSDACRNLKYICDLNEFIDQRGPSLDWDKVASTAITWKLSASLYTGLVLSKELFSTQLPRTILLRVKPSLPKRFFIGLVANRKFVLNDPLAKKIMNRFLSYIFFDLIEARSLNEYIQVFNRVFFPPDDFMKGRSRILRLFKGLGNFLAWPFLRQTSLNKTK